MAKPAYDKEKAAAVSKAKVEAAKAALEAGLTALQTSDDWAKMLTSMAVAGKLSVGRFSFRNQLLVQIQKAGTTRAATYNRWSQMNRQVKKGEKAATILQPVIVKAKEATGEPSKCIGFRALAVFALEQTEGADLPEVKVPSLDVPEAFEGAVEALKAVALKLDGVPVTSVEIRPRTALDSPTAHGWYVPATKAIVVISEGTRGAQFKTLVHEYAHALMHPKGDAHSSPEREVEAESVAFVVCHALGIDSAEYSLPYVATWAHGTDALKKVTEVGSRIQKTALTLLDALVGVEEEGEEALAA
jgi:hypothetical protein